jgi:hypothetical protein
MSTAQERYDEIAANYTSALNNELSDKANATKVAQVAAIEANVANAAAVFYSSAADQLSAQGANIEADYQQAVQANKTVADARNASAAIPDLLQKLGQATSAVGQLAASAKS